MNQVIEFFHESSIEIPLDEEEARRIISKVMNDLGRPEFAINIISFEDEALREMKKEYFQQENHPQLIFSTILHELVLS